MTMTAYHGDAAIKEALLERLRLHRQADHLVQGTYWDTDRGCAVGCSVHDLAGTPIGVLRDSGHELYPEILGIPAQLAHLEDMLFESLPVDWAMEWSERFSASIPIGADLSGVWDRFALWMLTDERYGMLQCAHEVRTEVERMGALFERAVAGDEPVEQEWSEAARAARAAWAAEAARAAEAAWAARAAEAAWAAWAARAAEAAWAARAAWAAWAAWAEWTTAACDELVRLLETAPVVTDA